MTVILPTVVTIDAVDQSDAPLHFQAGAAYDHDSTVGETLFAASGSDRYRLALNAKFTAEGKWTDEASAPVAPDILFSGTSSLDAFVGVFGSDARQYNFTTNQFGAATLGLKVNTSGNPALNPVSMTTADVGSGPIVAALRASEAPIYAMNASQTFDAALTPVTCAPSSAPITPNLVLAAALPGMSTTEDVIVVSGSDAFLLDLANGCFKGPFALKDADGAPLTPDFAFGLDYDGNGKDDIVIFDTK